MEKNIILKNNFKLNNTQSNDKIHKFIKVRLKLHATWITVSHTPSPKRMK